MKRNANPQQYLIRAYADKAGRVLDLEKRIAELEAMLVRVQWCADQEACGPSICCPVCNAVEHYKHGHEDWCGLAALLPKEAHDADTT